MMKLLTFLVFYFLLLTASTQNLTKIDSIKQAIAIEKTDTNLIKSYIRLGRLYMYNIPDTALYYYNKALDIAKKNKKEKLKAQCLRSIGLVYENRSNYNKAKEYIIKALNIFKNINYKDGVAACLGGLGDIYSDQGNYTKALKNYKEALKINEELNNKNGIAVNLGNIGIIYFNQSNYPKALEYIQKALKTNEKLNNKNGIAVNLGNIGIIYNKQKNYPKALEYYKKALKINKELNNKNGIAINLLNIANIYFYKEDYNKALEYFNKSLKAFEELNYKSGVAVNLGNIAFIYEKLNKIDKAFEYTQKALKINKELGNQNAIAINLNNIASLYNKQKQYKKTIEFAEKSLNISKKIGALDNEKDSYSLLSDAYYELGNYKKALKYTKKFITTKDSIFNDKKRKSIAKLEAKYEYEKKAAMDSIANAKQIEIKNAQIAKINTEKEAQRKQRNLLLIGLILILIFSVFIIRSYIQKKKANKLLSLQKQEIAEKNEELHQQNEEISAQRDEIKEQKNKIEEILREVHQSIDYATKIQAAILPDFNILNEKVTEYFVFFNPKDKVSGDFYWWTHIENHTIITAADCTGHGVPGAFMSMLGVSLLREIVEKEYITNTGVILRKLRKEIIKSLKQKGKTGEQKDGMDMAIISINHETNTVQFSGANNPLYLITNEELRMKNEENASSVKFYDNSEFKIQNSKFRFYEVKPNKMPIAIYEKMDNFTTHEFQLQKGDQLYMFSDGFADQFGGPKGKKFKYKPFKRLLLENADKPMNEQKETLEKTFSKWIEGYEQIDDVTVLGIKL